MARKPNKGVTLEGARDDDGGITVYAVTGGKRVPVASVAANVARHYLEDTEGNEAGETGETRDETEGR